MRTIRIVVLGLVVLSCAYFILGKIILPIIDTSIHSALFQAKDDGMGLTKEECVIRGGVWRKPGPSPTEICQIPSADGGKQCLSGFQCEWGNCVARLNLRSKVNLIDIGQCPTYRRIYGCVKYLSFGLVTRSVCLD